MDEFKLEGVLRQISANVITIRAVLINAGLTDEESYRQLYERYLQTLDDKVAARDLLTTLEFLRDERQE